MSVSLWLKGGVKLPDDFDTRKKWLEIPRTDKYGKPLLSKSGKPRVFRIRVDEMQRKMQKRSQSAGVTVNGNKAFQGEIARPAEAWRPEYAVMIYNLTLAQFGLPRIAETMGVRLTWLENLIETNATARKMYRKGSAEAAGEVAAALIERAKGYSHPSEKIFLSKDGDIVRAKTTMHYPPDTAACAMILREFAPGHWKDSHTTEITGPGGGPLLTANLHATVKEATTAKDAMDAYVKMLSGSV